MLGARKGWDLCDCCCYFPSQFTSKNQTVAKNRFHGYIGQRDCRWIDEVDDRHRSPEQVFVRQIAQPKKFRPTGDSCKFELNVPSRSEVDLRRRSQVELSVQELKAICQEECTILQKVTLKWCVFFPSATNVAKIENAVPCHICCEVSISNEYWMVTYRCWCQSWLFLGDNKSATQAPYLILIYFGTSPHYLQYDLWELE